jgi:hypothetical protein
MARDDMTGGLHAATRTGEKALRRPRAAAGALALVAAVLSGPALAQNPYCDDLRARIAHAGRGPGAARYRAAAAKQQQEIDRTVAYGHSIGCDRQQFLFFGEPPPPQCNVISRRIAQMRANLGALMRAGGDGDRQALMARYDQQCRTRVAARPRNFFDELFGGAQEEEPRPMGENPRGPYEDESEAPARGLGGSMAICVRACDGGFFPISYSARRANLEELAELCRAQCPNAEVELYTRSPWRELDTALSIEGKPYSEHPNASKFAKSYDATCGCKPAGRSWAETLAEAERLLSEKHRSDEIVSAEKAEQLSRPAVANVRRPGPTIETAPSFVDKAASHARETWREVVGPGGVKKRVRVIAPTL